VNKKSIILIVLFLLSIVNAASYSYDQKIQIIDSDGTTLGYVIPYQKEVLFKDYAYLKWKRYGFPEANTFPVALIKGTTVPLPFGLEGELLKVKVNSIGSSSIDLTIDKSNVITEIQNIPETFPENIEAINEEVSRQAEEIGKDYEEFIDEVEENVDEVLTQLNEITNILERRATKFVNRGYYSSLHIINDFDSESRRLSKKISDKEAEFAEKIADSVIPIIIDTFVAGAVPVTSLMYKQIIRQIPSEIRHQITKFIYNIGSLNDKYTDSSLSKKGAVTLYIGNPSENKVSKEMNSELKKLGLPYLDGKMIIGKRRYSEDSIGLIASLPEEKVWTERTLENRWENDKIRNYKTLIAGINDDGLEVASQWYIEQLEQAGDLISGLVSLGDGASLQDSLNLIYEIANQNPKSSLSSAALLQSWFITAMSSLQNAEFKKIDSLGYAVVVKKKGSGYDVLEVHTINGYQTNYFLNPYEVIEDMQEVAEIVKSNVEEKQEKITGKVVEEVEEEETQEPKKKEIPVISKIINFFKRWFW